jgi:hypothetical protein
MPSILGHKFTVCSENDRELKNVQSVVLVAFASATISSLTNRGTGSPSPRGVHVCTVSPISTPPGMKRWTPRFVRK